MTELERIWQIELEILDVIHNFCQNNHLRYSLAYGSLLGAVRHGGFIPWDDDIDIIMPREDYDVLVKLWRTQIPSEYILQNKEINPDFSQNFTKIRKDHTTFIQYEGEKHVSYHTGIFVDIFPGDRVAPRPLARKLQYFACAVNLLYSREHTSGTGGIVGMAEHILLKIPRGLRLKLRVKAGQYIERWNENKSGRYFFPSTIEGLEEQFPDSLFDDLQLVPFTNRHYYAVKDTDVFLRTCYGDYLSLPPVEERVLRHHPVLIDFARNYCELVNSDSNS